MSEDVGWNLLYPYVVTEDNGGPFDRRSFTQGVRFGKWATLLKVRPHRHQSYEQESLIPQLDLLAMAEGYTMTTRPHDDEWTLVIFTLGGAADG